MAPRLKDLCRLCARKHEILKNLLDKNNKNIVDIIRQFTQITIIECENMPTKICLDCEEKLVSIQLFILECYRTQDTLRNMCIEEASYNIKKEERPDSIVAVVKSEVKEELTAADIMYAINTEMNVCELDTCDIALPVDMGNDDMIVLDDEDHHGDDDDLDNLSIAALKEQKMKSSEEDLARLNELMAMKNPIAKKFVKLECYICGLKFKHWSAAGYHYYQEHRKKMLVHCLCGYPIRSLSGLYKHVVEHKGERDRTQDEQPKIQKYTKKIKGDNDGHETKIKVKDMVDMRCCTCDRTFSSWYKLSAHTERAHHLAPVVTCSCGVTLKSKSCLYKHIVDHRTPSNWSCDQCALVTKSEEALMKHKLRHVPKSDRRFQCSSCDKIFRSRDACRSHERKHIPVEQRQKYQCDHCELKFTTRSSAATHKRVVHEKVKSYVCDLCGYACGTGGELRQHRAIHSDEKPFVCSKCSKPFKTYSNLKTHMDTHEDTSYACYICNRVLNSRRTLRKHLLVHEDKCRHVCDYCNKAFKRRQTLKVHLYTHTGDKPLTCKWCGDRFAYASTLRSHRLRCHPDKMAASTYSSYTHLQQQQQEYIKSNLNAVDINVSVEKSEAEAMS